MACYVKYSNLLHGKCSCRICLVGGEGTGKTSPTTTTNTFSKITGNGILRLLVTSGNPKYFPLVSRAMMHADIICIVIARGQENITASLARWYDIVRAYERPVFVIENKRDIDLTNNPVPGEIKSWIEDNGGISGHFRTCSRVDNIFDVLVCQLLLWICII